MRAVASSPSADAPGPHPSPAPAVLKRPRGLPRGRHTLTREQVRHSQRERILRAMAETTAEQGYAATSVSDVHAAAGVSRKTFYEQFSSKGDCFMSAFEEAVQLLFRPVIAEAAGGEHPLARFAVGLRLYLDGLAAQPAYARMFMVEVYAAAPEIGRRRASLLDGYVELVNGVFGHESEQDRFAGRALVSAISMMVTVALMDDDIDGLRALHEPLVALAARLCAGEAGGSAPG